MEINIWEFDNSNKTKTTIKPWSHSPKLQIDNERYEKQIMVLSNNLGLQQRQNETLGKLKSGDNIPSGTRSLGNNEQPNLERKWTQISKASANSWKSKQRNHYGVINFF